MKRALSIILAIMMVATLLPVMPVFAEEGEADAGITITYDVAKCISDLGAYWESTPIIKFSEIDYELTNGLFRYLSSTSSTHESMGSSLNWNTGVIQMASGRYIAFEVFVPMAGTYKMNMYNALRGTSTETTSSVYLSRNKASTSASDLIGTYNCLNPEAGTSFVVVETPNVIENIEISEAGYYVFTFKANSSYGSVGKFELVCGDGSQSVLSGAVTAPQRIISIGAEHQFDLELYMNDGSAATKNYNVTYESNNTDVATVSESGVISARATGEAVITASIENENGGALKAEKKIIVAGEGVTVFYDINGIRVALGIVEDKTANPTKMLTALDYTTTNGFFDYVGTNHTYDGWDTTASGNAFRYGSSHIQLRKNKYAAFELNIPEAGTYDLQIKAGQSKDKRVMGPMQVYISKGAASTAKSDFVGSYAFYNETSTAATTKTIKDIMIPEAGKYVFTFCVAGENPDAPTTTDCYQYIGNLTLVSGTKSALMNGEITSTAASINVDESETATVSATGFNSSTTEAATFTYSSSNTDVAEVDATSGVVTPKSEGKATITATANTDVANKLTTDITVTVNKPGEVVADTMVNVGIEALTGGKVETSLENIVDEVAIGTKVSAEAIADDGYEFAYWTDSDGKVLSTSAEETFAINVNTSIKAYFEKLPAEDATTVPVYFYNGNGDKLATESAEKGTLFSAVEKPTATLTGFAFEKWSIADSAVINDITRAVALFKDADNTYTVKVGDKEIASGKKYGETVTVASTADDFVCWKLGEKVMSYEKSFTFDVYGSITLTEVTGEAVEAIPTVVLDKIDGEYFLTYNVPNGYTKLEAGILFATSGTPDIGSFYSKATEKTGSGQFTAKPNGTTDTIARGYLIFRDSDNTIRVIYAD